MCLSENGSVVYCVQRAKPGSWVYTFSVSRVGKKRREEYYLGDKHFRTISGLIDLIRSDLEAVNREDFETPVNLFKFVRRFQDMKKLRERMMKLKGRIRREPEEHYLKIGR